MCGKVCIFTAHKANKRNMRKNTIKGLAPKVKSSYYPDGSKSHKEWVNKPKSTFNEVFENVYFQTKNAK